MHDINDVCHVRECGIHVLCARVVEAPKHTQAVVEAELGTRDELGATSSVYPRRAVMVTVPLRRPAAFRRYSLARLQPPSQLLHQQAQRRDERVAVPHSPASPSGVQALKRVPSAPLPRASGMVAVLTSAPSRPKDDVEAPALQWPRPLRRPGRWGSRKHAPRWRHPQRAPCTARAARRHLRPRQRPPLRPSQSPHKTPILPRRLPLLCCHPVASTYWRRCWGANAPGSSLHPSAFRRQTHASAPPRQPQCHR